MANSKVTRRQLLVTAAPVAAAVPLTRLVASAPAAAPLGHGAMGMDDASQAMIGAGVPAPGGPGELDQLLYPPPPLSHQPGRVRDYSVSAYDREIEVAKGVSFTAWTYNGTVPGPVLRATEGDLLRVRF